MLASDDLVRRLLNGNPEAETAKLNAHHLTLALQVHLVPWDNVLQYQGESQPLARDKDPGSLKKHAIGTDVARHRHPTLQLNR
jgi:hypothetical protein